MTEDDARPRTGYRKERGDRDRGDGRRRPHRNDDQRSSKPRYKGDSDRKGSYGKDSGRRDSRKRDSDGKGSDRRGSHRKDSDRDGSYRKGSERKGTYRRDSDRREPGQHEETREAKPQEQKLTIPSTPQKILFKGVDCEVNGRKDLAMVLYLHGAVQMSGGCENNALRMLREMGPGEFRTVRGRVAKSCPDDAMIAYDYLCSTIDPDYDRTFINDAVADGNILAIYCKIRLEEIEGDDPCIDMFAKGVADHEDMVNAGLKLLVRKKDSVKAEEYLKKNEERRKLRQTIRPEFARAMKGDGSALKRLESLSDTFPEAMFLLGFIRSDDRENYLRHGMQEHSDTILSYSPELKMSDTPFGLYIAAKRLQADGGDWIPAMLKAVEAGCAEAMEELRSVQTRNDVRKALSSIYLSKGDAEGLVKCFDGEDTFHLDRYCRGEPERVIEVSRLMGTTRGVDWLKKNYLAGIEECKGELVSLASDPRYRGKQLIYTLHDVGAEMDAARLYMDMYGDPSLPAVKWLAKVCADEEAKEYLRSRFEEMGDLRTFESIFVDDGYDRKRQGGGRPSGRYGGRPSGRSGGFRKNDRRERR